ncbi:hypothetical protein CHS0354_012656, partial [Potamilus streckersoni]
MEKKYLNYNQAKHDKDNKNIIPPRTTTTTTITTITNPSVQQTTKPAPTTPIPARLDDNGRNQK